MVEKSAVERFVGVALGISALVCTVLALWVVTTEKHQGEVYRLIYIHVPSAFTAFMSAAVLMYYSVRSLIKPRDDWDFAGKAWAEVGLVFTLLTLFTGSVWGRPTWGVWWTWDARLTTTFILGLLYGGYLMLYASLDSGRQRSKICAVLGILIFVDVPIIYKSVDWWRTLHQPPSIIRKGGSTMALEILTLLLTSAAVYIALSFWLAYYRARNLRLEAEVERLSHDMGS